MFILREWLSLRFHCTSIGVPGGSSPDFPLVVKTLHALKACFSPPVLFLKLRNLVAHVVEFVELLLEAVILHLKYIFLHLLRV